MIYIQLKGRNLRDVLKDKEIKKYVIEYFKEEFKSFLSTHIIGIRKYPKFFYSYTEDEFDNVSEPTSKRTSLLYDDFGNYKILSYNDFDVDRFARDMYDMFLIYAEMYDFFEEGDLFNIEEALNTTFNESRQYLCWEDYVKRRKKTKNSKKKNK